MARPRRLTIRRQPIARELSRRYNAAHLAHGEGILVWPTNAGGVLGVDLLTGETLWAFLYGGELLLPPVPEGRRLPVVKPGGWQASAPIIHGGKVVIAPSDGDTLSCLVLR